LIRKSGLGLIHNSAQGEQNAFAFCVEIVWKPGFPNNANAPGLPRGGLFFDSPEGGQTAKTGKRSLPPKGGTFSDRKIFSPGAV
jgi:hypothetical protein